MIQYAALSKKLPSLPLDEPTGQVTQGLLQRRGYRLVTRGFDDYDLSRDIGGDLQEKDALVYNYLHGLAYNIWETNREIAFDLLIRLWATNTPAPPPPPGGIF